MAFAQGPLHPPLPEEDLSAGEAGPPPLALRHARLQSTPSSCYSDWDSSLWSTWSSVVDGDIGNSARTSLISSVDSCYTTDSAHLARLLAAAAAADTLSGCSLSGEWRKRRSRRLVLELGDQK